mmetsp:Transcript_4238/g.11003  ORF Transcript_4238/g.11003 Transcript_4238/m.11003 type:complete len:101 (+) Transcript_4238:75-377(+)
MKRWGNNPSLVRNVIIVMSDGSTYNSPAAYPHKHYVCEISHDPRSNPAYVASLPIDSDYNDDAYTKRLAADLLRKERENSLKFAKKYNKNRPENAEEKSE